MVVAILAAAFIPATPGLPWRIEIGVATTLLMEFALTVAYGAFPALQIIALFSVAVAGLFLNRRRAIAAFAGAIGLQAITIGIEVSGAMGDMGTPSDLIAETILLVAAGIGFLEIGGTLRGYQTRQLELARQELRLTELVESKDRLIDSIAHEIRTPITAVLGLSSELASGNGRDPVEASELAQLVATESGRLAHLVDNLVLRSRADIARLAFSSEVVSVRESVERAWSALGLDPDRLNIVGSAEVIADGGRLGQIMLNVLDNSARHGELPVTVRISDDDHRVAVSFQDSGRGFGGHQSTIFDRYAIDDVRTRPDGLGLGLPVSKMIAEQMGGGLTLVSDVLILELAAAPVTASR